jgi:hypothetical protein
VERPHYDGHLTHVAEREVPVSIVQPDPDRLSRYGDTHDNVKIVVPVDIRNPDRHGVVNGFECHNTGGPARDREFEAVRVSASTPADVIRNRDIGQSIHVEIADSRGPAERLGRITQPEYRAIQFARYGENGVRLESGVG